MATTKKKTLATKAVINSVSKARKTRAAKKEPTQPRDAVSPEEMLFEFLMRFSRVVIDLMHLHGRGKLTIPYANMFGTTIMPRGKCSDQKDSSGVNGTQDTDRILFRYIDAARVDTDNVEEEDIDIEGLQEELIVSVDSPRYLFDTLYTDIVNLEVFANKLIAVENEREAALGRAKALLPEKDLRTLGLV